MSRSTDYYRAIALVVVLLVTGCSSFNRQWREAGASPAAASDIAGRWRGEWRSSDSGHQGELRCLLSKKENNVYEARFNAKYLKILSFSYTVPLNVQRNGEVFNLKGEANLGKLGGVYQCEGRASPTNFLATYSSKYDHGTFEMGRP